MICMILIRFVYSVADSGLLLSFVQGRFKAALGPGLVDAHYGAAAFLRTLHPMFVYYKVFYFGRWKHK